MHDVIVANGRWHGGGMKLAPDARQDDGAFDVVTDRRRHQARLPHDGAEALQRPVPLAPEGRAPAVCDGGDRAPPSRCRSRSTASRSGRRRRASRSSRRRCGCGCLLRSVAVAAAAAFAALAGLVASGATTGLDQWAVEHAMPLAGRPSPAADACSSRSSRSSTRRSTRLGVGRRRGRDAAGTGRRLAPARRRRVRSSGGADGSQRRCAGRRRGWPRSRSRSCSGTR